MDSQLLTLSKIFTERLFRIPDYQRGYAWTERQLKDFWNDIDQLEVGRNHYTGVLTLETVPSENLARWDDDQWIVQDKSYAPFFVVDGQQRLTTSIILLQVIVERMGDREKLNHNSKEEIQKKFLFDSKDDGISRSYIFGYEKDNPSYEFLKSKVFKERITSGELQETIYTQNLENAKTFFIEKTEGFTIAPLEQLYKKLTQHLLFNIFTISEDVDVCVAFETMNNRGKPLSYLELLKNRLIYLSYKIVAPDSEQQKLRRAINDCWKAIYHSLGKNKNNPLDDDKFLLTHYIVYFGKKMTVGSSSDEEEIFFRRVMRIDYPRILLEKTFIAKNILDPSDDQYSIDLKFIFSYVSSLQESVESWYKIFNPYDSGYSAEIIVWLDKLNRIGNEPYLPLLLVALQRVSDQKKLLSLLQSAERHLFLLSLVLRYSVRPGYLNYYPPMTKLAIDMWTGTDAAATADKVVKSVQDTATGLAKNEAYTRDVVTSFRNNGFYSWDGIRYFLYEYNLSLQEVSKTNRPKIVWAEFMEDKKDFISVEHIYPQQARHQYWVSRFGSFSQKRKDALRNSLGNLLPLSKPKNSSLSNKPFDQKARPDNGSVVCYAYGSYAEIEVSSLPEWGPQDIRKRGLKLVQFMERRWSISFGDEKSRVSLLGIEFL